MVVPCTVPPLGRCEPIQIRSTVSFAFSNFASSSSHIHVGCTFTFNCLSQFLVCHIFPSSLVAHAFQGGWIFKVRPWYFGLSLLLGLGGSTSCCVEGCCWARHQVWRDVLLIKLYLPALAVQGWRCYSFYFENKGYLFCSSWLKLSRTSHLGLVFSVLLRCTYHTLTSKPVLCRTALVIWTLIE